MALRQLVDYGDEYQEEEDVISSSSSISDRTEKGSEARIVDRLTFCSVESIGSPLSGLKSVDEPTSPSQPAQLYGFPQCIELADEEKIVIPEDNSLPVSEDLEDRYTQLLNVQRQTGRSLNTEIQRSKDFRNPSIYQKLIEYCGIQEFGSNFPADQFDPTRWTGSSSVEELARVQAIATEKQQEKDRRSGKPQDVVNKRKTKWDSEPASKRLGNALGGRKNPPNLYKTTK